MWEVGSFGNYLQYKAFFSGPKTCLAMLIIISHSMCKKMTKFNWMKIEWHVARLHCMHTWDLSIAFVCCYFEHYCIDSRKVRTNLKQYSTAIHNLCSKFQMNMAVLLEQYLKLYWHKRLAVNIMWQRSSDGENAYHFQRVMKDYAVWITGGLSQWSFNSETKHIASHWRWC